MSDLLSNLSQAADPVLLDGGLSTALEEVGFRVAGPLWTSEALVTRPNLVQRCHESFVTAGAEIVSTATYQLSGPALARAGSPSSPRTVDELFGRAVRLARRATHFAASRGGMRGPGRPPIVAVSLGPYGAALGDGSEYRGDYAASSEVVAAFHAERLESVKWSGGDLILFETLPNLNEVRAILRLVEACEALPPVWMSLSLSSPSHLADGSELVELVRQVSASPVTGLGVNCVRPSWVAPALEIMSSERDRDLTLLAYPNAGQQWDPSKGTWSGTPQLLEDSVASWVRAGASVIGGCCGVGPETLQRLRERIDTL